MAHGNNLVSAVVDFRGALRDLAGYALLEGLLWALLLAWSVVVGLGLSLPGPVSWAVITLATVGIITVGIWVFTRRKVGDWISSF